MASSQANATPDVRRQTFIPAAALKRFANQLESEGTNNKFLQINRNRVNEFLDKAPEIPNTRHAPPKQESRSKIKIPGIHEYPEKTITPTFLSLQNTAEFQHSLGDRSRFGQGDGSFFDQWLNADVVKSKHVLDKDGLPLMKFSLSQQSGFKKHLSDFKNDYKKPEGAVQYIKPYTQRREERLKMESAASSAPEPLPKPAPSASVAAAPPTDSRPVTRASVSTAASSSLHLPPITNVQLTATDRENYFGDQARQTFFDYYRQLARQRYTVGEINDQDAIDRIRYGRETESAGLEQEENHPTGRSYKHSEEGGDQYYYEGEEESEGHLSLGLTGGFAKKPSALAEDMMGESVDASDGGSHHLLAAMEKSQPHAYYARHGAENAKHREEERQLLLAHLAPPLGTRPSTATSVGPTSPRPFSARSKFLLNCVKRDIIPQPSIIIRKEVTSTLNIQSMGIGNELAALLSESLDSLPLLEGLVIGDNKLNDAGLVPIVNRLYKCVNLKSFDLSNNKVDSLTADALLHYISSPQCNLVQLIMAHADVDDNECARFMSAIAERNTIEELDLSQNLLGSHEHALNKADNSTAGEAIGRVLAAPNCSLRKLNVAWNMIRYTSGVVMMKSLALNHTLTYLDISYNALGVDGGEALGDALHSNKALVHLNISHNNICARAAFTIISGVRSCKTISELDISENPIGEKGARALLGLNMHEGHRLTVNIKGCSLKVADKTCWFDSNHIEKEFTLNLGHPYDRAVCFDLLRIVSQMDGWTVNKFLYTAPEEASPSELKIAVFAVKEAPPEDITRDLKTAGLTDRSARDEEEDAFEDVGAARQLFRKAAAKVFRQVDHDENGTLDKNELLDVLFQMGIKSSQGMAEKLLSIYDTDGSGRIEEEEFVQFIEDINHSVERVAKDHSERRYIYSNPNGVEYTDQAPPVEYIPPDKGKVVIKIAGSKTVSDFVHTISKQSVETMLEATKGLPDSGALFECALSVMKLDFNEAKTFYRVLVKDSGSEQSALVRLLPNMASPAQARLMIAYATGNDFVKLHHVRAYLGQSYRIFIGLPNGFYRLNLADERDYYCMERLVELSNTHKIFREKHKLGDTSQNGDYHGFRNVLMDGHPFQFTEWFFDSIPHKGKVEFDFVCMEQVSMKEPTISNFRLYRLMSGLGMIEEDQRKRAFARMKFQYAEGREASKGSGVKKWETSNKAAQDVNSVLRRVYVEYASGHRPAFDDVIHIEKEEMMFIERSKEGVRTLPEGGGEAMTINLNAGPAPGRSATDPSYTPHIGTTTTPLAAGAAANLRDSRDEEEQLELQLQQQQQQQQEYMSPALGNTPKNQLSGMDGAAGENHDPSLDHFDTHVKLMVQSEMVSPYTIAVRTLTMLDTALAGRYLTCAQLAMLLDKFPSLSSKSTQNDFISPKVELVVRLHSKLVDLINFDYVLKELVPHEYAMLVFRLGWLNIWNPMKPEGAIFLDLSRREDKQVVRMLLVLNFSEGPLHSWMEPYYRPAGSTELPDEQFKINSSWFTENTLPSSGTLSLTYYSGKGAGLLDCNPVVQCRLALMSLVLAHPYEEDLPMMFGQPMRMTLDSVEEYLTLIGCELAFDTKTQQLKKQLSPRSRGGISPKGGGSRQVSPRSPRLNPAATATASAALVASSAASAATISAAAAAAIAQSPLTVPEGGAAPHSPSTVPEEGANDKEEKPTSARSEGRREPTN